MKKLSTLFFCAVTFTIVTPSCTHSSGDTSLTLTESDHYYSMYAHFNKNKTRDVEKYMDNLIGKQSNMSFVNTRYLIKLITRYQIKIFTLQHRHLYHALVILKPNRCL